MQRFAAATGGHVLYYEARMAGRYFSLRGMGFWPTDRETILQDIRKAKATLSEDQLRSYRDSIESL